METLTIKNLNLMVKLDRMAQAAYSHIATYQNDPLPNISLQRLREKMKDSEPVMDKDNSIDYGYRNFNFDWSNRKSAFLNAFRLETNTNNWYFDEILLQPPTMGWSAWNNNHYKPKNFIRFIHNAGEGFTHWVDDGKWSYIPDKHTAVNKDWTVIAGRMDGNQWLSDRNRSAKPRFVCEIAIPSYNVNEWENAKEIVESVN